MITTRKLKSRSGVLLLHTEVVGARFRKEFLLSCAEISARRIKKNIGEINLIVVTDRKMAKLHHEYSGISGTTDVLTFDLSESKKQIDGDIFMCLDQAKRQAQFYNVPLYKEMARLASHGLLHLAGYNDKTELQKQKMRKLEDQVLAEGEKLSRA